MFKYTRVQLNRSETTVITLDVPPWEVAVMAAANGEDRVQIIGETPVNKMLPDPGAEYDRLATRYKHGGDTETPYVAAVYGLGQRGVDQLAKEIYKAQDAAQAPPVQSAEYDSNDDPLGGLFDDAPPAGRATEAVEIGV
jgi:hypothetical protein